MFRAYFHDDVENVLDMHLFFLFYEACEMKFSSLEQYAISRPDFLSSIDLATHFLMEKILFLFYFGHSWTPFLTPMTYKSSLFCRLLGKADKYSVNSHDVQFLPCKSN